MQATVVVNYYCIHLFTVRSIPDHKIIVSYASFLLHRNRLLGLAALGWEKLQLQVRFKPHQNRDIEASRRLMTQTPAHDC